MSRGLVVFLVVFVLALAAFAWVTRGDSKDNAVVAAVIDGDTIELVGGQRVRLVQIDTPEKHVECYGDQASALTRRLIPAGTHVRIEQDPKLDQVDRFQRKLAYVWKGDEDVNVTLVRGRRRGRLVLRRPARPLRRRVPRRGRGGPRRPQGPLGRVPARALRPERVDVERPG